MNKKLTKRISTVIAAAAMALSMQTTLNAYATPPSRPIYTDPATGKVMTPITKINQNNIDYTLYEGNVAHVNDGRSASGRVEIPDVIYSNGTCYVVTTIEYQAFLDNNNITAVDMQNAKNLTTIEGFAFWRCKNLETVSLPDKMEINDSLYTAFYECGSLREFTAADPENYNIIDGILYNKDNTVIIKYPSAKPDESFTLNEGVYAGEKSFDNLRYLNKIVVPEQITESNAADIISRCAPIISGIKANSFSINGIDPFVYTDDDSEEPQILPLFKEAVYDNFDKFSKDITDYYAKRYAAYVVNSIIDDEDSDFARAVKLHDWLCGHTEYDPVIAQNRAATYPNFTDAKDHCYASAFLHYVKADGDCYKHDGYYTVCDGYARAYKLLMNAAGISCERVKGASNKDEPGHAWNIVRLNDKDDDAGNDKYYYVDVTWDSKYRYGNFMSFGNAGNGSHREYMWSLETEDAFDTLPAEADILAKPGDADHNGKISVNDYLMIKEFIAAGTYDESADINADGQVNNDDADILAAYMLDYPQNTLSNKSMGLPDLDAKLIKGQVYNTYPEFNYGDIDNSGNLNVADSMMIKNIISAEAEGNSDLYTDDQRTRADIDRNDKVDKKDSALLNDYLNKAIAGETPSFCQYLLDRIIDQ